MGHVNTWTPKRGTADIYLSAWQTAGACIRRGPLDSGSESLIEFPTKRLLPWSLVVGVERSIDN